jgi:hypothetical protein
MTLQLLHSKYPYIRGKFSFLFYQCTVQWTLLYNRQFNGQYRHPPTAGHRHKVKYWRHRLQLVEVLIRYRGK